MRAGGGAGPPRPPRSRHPERHAGLGRGLAAGHRVWWPRQDTAVPLGGWRPVRSKEHTLVACGEEAPIAELHTRLPRTSGRERS